ncbi:TonB-dependent receptor domain-containing protein [Polaribacter sp.]|uniref:TonB-dependent receptor domain-containing protein n=1 Tax=Polaribacter sp. TaxID=1920175 RepID=UPI003F6BDB86
MKKIILLFLILTAANSTAQLAKNKLPKPGIITGKVIDNNTKQVLPYVNIVVRDVAKKIINGGITNDNGFFEVKDLPKGKSIVEIQFIGYKTFVKEILITNKLKLINLGTIALNEDSATLDEVVVRAETSTVVQKVDRKVINVGKDLTASGTTASELLNNVQSVSVDNQTGAISLRGNANVRILVDGRPTNIPAAQLLRQIPSTSIKSVELITNPSAKYNPDGMSGIINIILNKNANQGFNASVDGGITAGHYVRYNTSTNLNYKTGKVNFFMNYGYNDGDNYNFGFVERPGVNLQRFTFKNNNQSNLVKLGADFYLNDKNTLSFYTTQNLFDGVANGSAIILDASGNELVNAPNEQLTSSPTGTYNINYKVDFEKEGHNLEVEATYSKTDGSNFLNNLNTLQQPTDFDYAVFNYINDINNDRNNTQINIDYTNPFKKGKLELGMEFRGDNTDNLNITDQNIYSFDTNNNINGTVALGSSDFSFERKIYSAYASYGTSYKKLTMQLGARFENFLIDGTFNRYNDENRTMLRDTETVSQNLFNIYPSAFFTYTASDKNQYQLSYSRRIDRPGIQQVNPIREWSTPYIISIGNADLRPQFTNSFELNYTRQIKGGNLSFGTFYRKIDDVISRITNEDPANPGVGQILSFTNFSDTDAYGVEFSANFKVNKWWRVNSSMDFYSQEQLGTVDNTNVNPQQISVQNNVFNARVSNSFAATKNLRLQLFAMYRGPQKDIQWDVENMWMINMGASWTVLKGKGTINFRVNDIFQGMKFAFNSENPFVQNGQFNWESRTTFLGFNYRFGGGKNKAKSRRQRDDREKDGGGGFF